MLGSAMKGHFNQTRKDIVASRDSEQEAPAVARPKVSEEAYKGDRPLAEVVGDWLNEGRLLYKTVQTSKTKLMRGCCISNSLLVAPEFQVFLIVTLHSVHAQDRSIAHFAINGQTTSHLPSLSVRANGTDLVATVRHGSFHVEIPGPALALRVATPVRFMLYKGQVSFEVGTWRRQVEVRHLGIKTEDEKDRLWVFFASPLERPARATISNANYYAHLAPSRANGDEQVAFRLPLREQAVIDESQKEIARNKKWAAFDSFFAVFVVINSITIGIQAEHPADWLLVLDNVFLVIFIVEFVLRVVAVTRESANFALFLDPWLNFDFMVIFTAILDQWILQEVELPKFLRALRLLRLLKLAKLVRLIRSFRELSLLLQGLILSLRTLLWCFTLMGMILFGYGVLVVRLVRWDTVEDDPETRDWAHLASAMWKLTALATLDDWGRQIRWAVAALPGWRGAVLAVALLIFLVVTAFGVLNIVIGIMCQTSTRLAVKQRLLASAEHLYTQREAAAVLRKQMRNFGERPLFKSDRTISCEEIFEALVTDPKMQRAAATLGMTSEDFVALCDAFEDRGEVEIDGLCEAIGIICLQGYSQRASSDLLVETTGDALRPIDALFFQFSLLDAESAWEAVEKKAQRCCTYVYDALSSLYARTHSGHTLLRAGVRRPWMPLPSKQYVAAGHVSVKALARLAGTFNRQASEAKLMMPLDVTTAVLLMFNAIVQTASAIGYGHSRVRPLYISLVDVALALAFCVEFTLRAIMICDLRYVRRWPSTTSNVEAMNIERKRFMWLISNTWYRIIPPLPPAEAHQVLVDGFTEDSKWLNGVYEQGGLANGSPFYNRRGSIAAVLYKLPPAPKKKVEEDEPKPLVGWAIAPHLEASQREIFAFCSHDEPYALPPLHPDHLWEINDDATFAVEGEPEVTASRVNSLWQLLLALPHIMREWASLLDFVVIFFTVLDAVVFEIIRRAGAMNVDMLGISVLRTIRIFRLFMVLRVLKMLPVLQNLFASLVNVWRTLFWMAMFILLVIYVYALYMVALTSSLADKPGWDFFFGGVASALVTAFQLSTFDHWEPIVQLIRKEAPGHLIPTFALFILICLGVLKMVVGVMCNSTVSLQRARNREQSDADVVLFIRKMEEVHDLVVNQLGTGSVPQESIETAFDIKLRPRSQLSGDDSSVKFSGSVMLKLAREPAFCNRLRELLEDARLTPELIRKIYDKMDPRHTGFLSVDLITKGGIMVRKAAVNKVNMFALSTGIREVRRLCGELSAQLTDCRLKLDDLLQDTATLLSRQRRTGPPKPPLSPRSLLAKVKAGAIDAEVGAVLDELSSYTVGAGVQDVPCIRSLGEAQLTRGTGTVEVALDGIVGHGTDFRKSLAPGDLLIIERPGGVATEAGCVAVVCSAVLDATHCRVVRSSKMAEILGSNPYTVVSLSIAPKAFIHFDGDISLSVPPPPLNLSPRKSQQIFDWRLETWGRKKHAAWMARGELWEDYIKLQDDLHAITICEVAKEVMHLWSDAAKSEKALREQRQKQSHTFFRW